MQCACNVKTDDQVEVVAGRDKGRVGKVLRVYRSKNKAVVEKINMVKRHTKPNQSNQQGGIIEKESLVDVSNLMVICPKCSKTSRIGRKIMDDGSKIRFCKKCGEPVEQ
jgi:large subunit ribosomal protein L24